MNTIQPPNEIQLRKWIIATLVDDEVSTDEELVAHFMNEGRLTEIEARRWVAQRNYFMGRFI